MLYLKSIEKACTTVHSKLEYEEKLCFGRVCLESMVCIVTRVSVRDESSAPIDLVYVFVLEHPQTGNAMYLLDDSTSDGAIISDFACDSLAPSPKHQNINRPCICFCARASTDWKCNVLVG